MEREVVYINVAFGSFIWNAMSTRYWLAENICNNLCGYAGEGLGAEKLPVFQPLVGFQAIHGVYDRLDRKEPSKKQTEGLSCLVNRYQRCIQ